MMNNGMMDWLMLFVVCCVFVTAVVELLQYYWYLVLVGWYGRYDGWCLIKEEKKSKAKRKELEILHEKIAFEWEWATASKSNVAHRVVNGKKPLLPLNFRAVSKYFFFSYMHDSAHVVAVLWIKNQRIAVKRKQARKNETSSTTTTTYLPTYAVGTTWNSKLETLSVL